jgi:hypothetical protein
MHVNRTEQADHVNTLTTLSMFLFATAAAHSAWKGPIGRATLHPGR